MGQCCSSNEPIVKVALKFPNGTNAIQYDSDTFVPCNINEWLQQLYTDSWSNWVVYNDETKLLGNNDHKKGHCKGIVAWNKTHVSWLIHSVPNFPREFTGTSISKLEPNEHIYGQSFLYLKMKYNESLLASVLDQVQKMEAHIFMYNGVLPSFTKEKQVSHIELVDTITHVGKPPSVHIDIYHYLKQKYPGTWYVQTWKRGYPVAYAGVHDIQTMKHGSCVWSGSQDHSKWGVNEEGYVWIGDLNRMSSQEKRGGGGVILHHPALAKQMKELLTTWVTGK